MEVCGFVIFYFFWLYLIVIVLLCEIELIEDVCYMLFDETMFRNFEVMYILVGEK